MYRLYMVVNDFTKEVNKNNISALASSAAFFIFLSLIPILMLICSILPYTIFTQADFMHLLNQLLPDTVAPLLIGMMTEVYDKSPTAVSVSAVIILWSAAKGVMAINRGLNLVNRVEETRNYVVLRCQAAFYTVIILVVVIFFLLVMVFGNLIIDFMFARYPDLSYFWHLIMHFRFLFVWIIIAAVFALLYVWLPNRRMNFKQQLPGAVFSAVAWSLFTWAFSLYVEYFNTFSIYGSLTTIIIVMLWIYICMYIFLIGAEINQYFMPYVRYHIRGKIMSKRNNA